MERTPLRAHGGRLVVAPTLVGFAALIAIVLAHREGLVGGAGSMRPGPVDVTREFNALLAGSGAWDARLGAEILALSEEIDRVAEDTVEWVVAEHPGLSLSRFGVHVDAPWLKTFEIPEATDGMGIDADPAYAIGMIAGALVEMEAAGTPRCEGAPLVRLAEEHAGRLASEAYALSNLPDRLAIALARPGRHPFQPAGASLAERRREVSELRSALGMLGRAEAGRLDWAIRDRMHGQAIGAMRNLMLLARASAAEPGFDGAISSSMCTMRVFRDLGRVVDGLPRSRRAELAEQVGEVVVGPIDPGRILTGERLKWIDAIDRVYDRRPTRFERIHRYGPRATLATRAHERRVLDRWWRAVPSIVERPWLVATPTGDELAQRFAPSWRSVVLPTADHERWDEIILSCLQAELQRRAIVVRLALEGFYADHGVYPPRLDELVPTYLDEVPIDPLDPAGGTLSYRAGPGAGGPGGAGGAPPFVLYSVGWDGSDDGGRADERGGWAIWSNTSLDITLHDAWRRR
jgi:hypothetical protein